MATSQQFVAEALLQVGKPYVYGAAGPDAFDCEGLVYYCLQAIGIKSCPRGSEEQWAWCDKTTLAALRPGDLIFEQWPNDGTPPGHVVIVNTVDNQKVTVIEAPQPGFSVWVRSWSAVETIIVGYGSVPGLDYVGLDAPDWVPPLKLGSTGASVIELQLCLNEVQQAGLVVDGVFGPLTEAALKTFQSAHGQKPDGVYAIDTAGTLIKALDLSKEEEHENSK